jgi:hypothetical protein
MKAAVLPGHLQLFFCVCVDARWPSARHTTGDNMSVNITFLGGADTVTGSRYLISHDKHRLLVDCGLFQGVKQLRLRNRSPLPVAPTRSTRWC